MYPVAWPAHNPTSRRIIAVVNHRSRSTKDVGERLVLNLISTSNIWRLQNTLKSTVCIVCAAIQQEAERAKQFFAAEDGY